MKQQKQAVTNPEGTIYEVKRLIGRLFDAPDKEDMKHVPYQIIKGKGMLHGLKLKKNTLQAKLVHLSPKNQS